MKRPDGRSVLDDPDHIRIVEEAAVWLARLRGGKPSKAEHEAFNAWLTVDSRHAEAYANLDKLWQGSINLPGMKERHLAVKRAVSRRNFGKGVIAAAVGIGAFRYLADHPFADYRTAVGERRTTTLPDGSTVELAAETRLSLAYTSEKRRLILHGGEVFFTVAKDARRPFVVDAGSGQTVALGTAFGIESRGGKATVVVTESAVSVALGTQSSRVAAGYLVTYDGQKIGAAHESESGAELAWREGRLVFAQAPLGEVVAALNRWRSGHIIVMSPSLAERPITMIVDLNRSDAIVSQLAQAVPIRIVNIASYATLLFQAG